MQIYNEIINAPTKPIQPENNLEATQFIEHTCPRHIENYSVALSSVVVQQLVTILSNGTRARFLLEICKTDHMRNIYHEST